MKKKLFTRNLQRWNTYCPNGAALLSNHKFSTKEDKIHDTPKEAEGWFKTLELYNVNSLFVFGVGHGHYYKAAKDWLLKSADHQLIFLEEDLDVIHRLLETELGKELIFDNQVWLEFFKSRTPNSNDIIDLSSLPFFFFTGDIEVSAIAEYYLNKPRELNELINHLQYLKNIKLWEMTEDISMGQGFFKNFYRNLLNLPNARLSDKMFKKFAGVPAIICGAGPSLDKNRVILETLKDKALIFAGGSSMNVLNETGFLPHFGVGIDPNMAQFTRLLMNQAFETPFFFRMRMYAEALELVQGEHIFVRGSAGYKIATWFEEKLGLTGNRLPEGHNVINFSLAIAAALGCNPIILVGVDLAYSDGASYARGVYGHPLYDQDATVKTKAHSEELLIKNDIYGNPIHTLWKWVMESAWYTEYASMHPELKIINSTEGGIGFESIPNIPLKHVAESYLQKSYDLNTMIKNALEDAKMPETVSQGNIVAHMIELEKSLARCEELCKNPTPENIAKLHQEDAYTHLLLQFNDSFLAFSGKSYVTEFVEEINEEDKSHVESKKALINTRRYEFLRDACSYNRKEIIKVLDESAIRRAIAMDVEPNARPKNVIPYKNGLIDGDVLLYHPNGKLYRRIAYKEGKRHGIESLWNMIGVLEYQIEYDNNNPIGTSRGWWSNGRVAREVEYDKNSKVVSIKQWDQNGILIPQENAVESDYFKSISKQTGVLTTSLEYLYDQILKLTPNLPNIDLKGDIGKIKDEMDKLKQLEMDLQAEVGKENELIWKTPTARRMMGKQLEEATKKMAEDISSMEQVIQLTFDLMMEKEKKHEQ